MGAVKKDHWYFVVLLFLPIVKETVSLKEHVAISALEEGMVLDCVCPWNGSLSLVSWTKAPDKEPIAVLHPELGTSFPHQYRERVEFLRRSALDGSIALRNVTHQDIGLYHCSVQTFPRAHGPPASRWRTWVSHLFQIFITIKFQHKLVSGVAAVLNENLTLSCTGLPNVTVYQVIMERLESGRSWAIIGVCKSLDAALLSEDYSERGTFSCDHSLDVTLQLVQVQQEDSGFYRCTFHTETGIHSTTMTLSVSEPVSASVLSFPGGISLSMYMFYIYCGAGIAGLLLLIAIIIVVVRHR
uniref:CD226 molecule n=1 Tax=Neogobius melanostomus TaxID=47308 RepID=A0A8C6U9Y9_9GOBI